MKNKTIKFLLKVFMFFPVCFGVMLWFDGFDLNDWIFKIVVGFVGAFGLTFWQLFDYEKYSDIAYEDFLESKHSLRLDNSEENWSKFQEMIENPLLKLKITEKTENKLKVQIERKIIDSILTVSKTPDAIIVNIENKFFSFLPDRAENYRIIQKLAKRSQRSKSILTSGA
ncbi:hypothetical protein [Maribacter litoralis]|uniref:Uncharacterized protein n=1 Tax=Maribacter litoralis TaxID=2059726 RepID=A0A653ULB6_9FLAO|nr:hypothetical protein [Maribacter litoralis]VXB94648.1 conserved hypothetical protein [Maribacter litoralis]